jgi:protein tyrosine phosphatase (PTP) superfamily phosphohydrolase (DUF442 family)
MTVYYVSARWLAVNFHVVVPGQVYRSAQPSSKHIERWARDHHIRTIFNLRNEADSSRVLREREFANGLGVDLWHYPLSDRSLPDRYEFLALIEALEAAPTPILIHCRAGADRTGVLSVLAAMVIGGQTYDEARSQVSLRYLHLGDDHDAVEGVLTKYENHCRRHGRDTGGWQEFRAWAYEHYCDTYYLVDIQAPARIEAEPGQLLEIELTVRNRTDIPIPVEDDDRIFSLAAYLGTAVEETPVKEFPPRTRLDHNVQPEGSVHLIKQIKVTLEPGVYEIHFDLIEEHVTWFAAQGSPEIPYILVIESPELH